MERPERYLTAFVSAEVGAQNVVDGERRRRTWRTPPDSSDSAAAASSERADHNAPRHSRSSSSTCRVSSFFFSSFFFLALIKHSAYKLWPTVSYILVLADISRLSNGGEIYIFPQLIKWERNCEELSFARSWRGTYWWSLLMVFHFIRAWISS